MSGSISLLLGGLIFLALILTFKAGFQIGSRFTLLMLVKEKIVTIASLETLKNKNGKNIERQDS